MGGKILRAAAHNQLDLHGQLWKNAIRQRSRSGKQQQRNPTKKCASDRKLMYHVEKNPVSRLVVLRSAKGKDAAEEVPLRESKKLNE